MLIVVNCLELIMNFESGHVYQSVCKRKYLILRPCRPGTIWNTIAIGDFGKEQYITLIGYRKNELIKLSDSPNKLAVAYMETIYSDYIKRNS